MLAFLFVKYEIIILKKIGLRRAKGSFNSSNSWLRIIPRIILFTYSSPLARSVFPKVRKDSA